MGALKLTVLVVVLLTTITDVSHALSVTPDTKNCIKPLCRISQVDVYSSTRLLMALKDQDEIDSVTKEAEDAIKAATSLISDTDSLLNSKSLLPPPPPPPPPPQRIVSTMSLSSLEQTRLIAATFSGTIVGAILSVIIETQFDDLGGVEPSVVTGVLAVALGATTYVVGKNPDETNLISKSLRFFLGQPVLNLGDAIKEQIRSSIKRTTDEITSIPSKIQNKVEQTVDNTVATIQSIPSNVQRSIEQQIQQTQDAAAQKVQDTVTSIQQIPEKVKGAALDIADEIVTEIKATPTRVKDAALDIADEIAAEIKATPEKVQKSATAFVQDTIEDITAIPSKIVASVESTVNNGGSTTTLPQPPKLPPPIPKPPKQAEPDFALPEIPKIEIPRIDMPTLPVLELPSIPKVDLPPIPKIESVSSVTVKKPIQPKVDTAAIAKKKAQSQAAAAANAAKLKIQQEQAAAKRIKEKEQLEQQNSKLKAQQEQDAAKRKKEKEQEQLEQQKMKLQQAKIASAEREKQLLAQQAAKEERERQRLAAEQAREQEILRKAEEALQRSREAEEKKKRQELERKKQQEEAAKKRQEQLAEQQAVAQLKKQGSVINGSTSSSGSFRIAATPANRAPRGVPTIVSWKQRKDGGISGRIYGSTNFNDGERIETSVIASGTVDNGFVVKTDSGSRYFLSTEKPNSKSTPDSTSPIQSLLSALPGATITLTKSAQDKASSQKEAAAKKKAEITKPRPTFSLFGSPIAPASSNENRATSKVTKNVAPRGVPTIQRWRKNRDGSVTGLIYGSSSFSDGEQITTSPIASGTLESGEVVRTGSGSRYFLG